MWLMTTRGHYSVVEYQGDDYPSDDHSLMVRARSRVDLERLCQLDPMAAYAERIEHTPFADYPWRIWRVDRTLFSAALILLVGAIDYPNFKDAVRLVEPARAPIYTGVWDRLFDIQHAEDERE